MPRRLLVFKLRTLFVLLTALCALLAWSTNLSWKQHVAVGKIQQLGGTVVYEHEGLGSRWWPALLSRVTDVQLDGLMDKSQHDIADEDVSGIVEALPYLTRLNVNFTNVTDEVCNSLASCRELEWVSLCGTNVSDKGIANLRAALPNCECQRIFHVEIEHNETDWRGTYYTDLINDGLSTPSN